jgi:hypothetical protein
MTMSDKKDLQANAATTNCSIASMICERIMDEEMRFPQPFWHEKTLYVTDGRILVQLQNQEKPERAWLCEGGRFVPPKDEPERTWQRSISQTAVTDLIAAVGVCETEIQNVEGPANGLDMLWRTMVECDRCFGRGWRRCDMDHEHDCEECDGEGTVFDVDESATDVIEVCGTRIQRRYAWLVSKLPGVQVGIAVGINGIAFRFRDGCGVVMAIK